MVLAFLPHHQAHDCAAKGQEANTYSCMHDHHLDCIATREPVYLAYYNIVVTKQTIKCQSKDAVKQL